MVQCRRAFRPGRCCSCIRSRLRWRVGSARCLPPTCEGAARCCSRFLCLRETRVTWDQRKYRRERRERAIANGLCGSCCLRPPRAGRKTCQPCTDQTINWQNRLAARGLCPCGEPKKPDHRRCDACLQLARLKACEYRRRIRDAAKSSPTSTVQHSVQQPPDAGGPRKDDSARPVEVGTSSDHEELPCDLNYQSDSRS